MKNIVDPQHVDSFGNLAIKGIEEVVLPDPVSYFPQTIGWKIVGLAICLFVAYKSYYLIRQWWYNRYRRAALKEIEQLSGQKIIPGKSLAELSILLKATALHVYPREYIAKLSGHLWLMFLNQQAGYTAFDEISVNLLSVTVYKSPDQINENDLQHLMNQVEFWIKKHPNKRIDAVLEQGVGDRGD